MPISNSYPKGVPIEDQDLFVGTKAANNRTVNYTAQGVADYLNINSKVAIGGQMSFQFTVVPNIPKTITFEGGFGDGTAFSAITKLIVSAIDLSTANITIFLNYLNNSQVLLSQQNQPNFFGHYKITGYTQIGTSAFYELDLEFIGGNGTIGDKQYYDLVSFVLSAETAVPTLQQVLDNNHDLVDGNNFQGTGAGEGNNGIYVNGFGEGAVTDNIGNSVNAFGINSGANNTGYNLNAFGALAGNSNTGGDLNAFGNGAGLRNIGNSVNFLGYGSGENNTGDAVNALGGASGQGNTGTSVNAFGYASAQFNSGNNVNFFGAQAGLSNTFNNVNLFGALATADANNQNVFSKLISGVTKYLGRLSFNNITADRKWELPDASGTLALTSNIGNWGALNYPTWTTGTPFVKMTAVGTFALDTTIYYPAPTGTIAEYIRGDGSLAAFPTATIPTLQEVLDNNHDLVDGNNFQGTGAGGSNTGSYVNALGNSAGYNNTGIYVNALGHLAGYNNTGDNLNAIGGGAGYGNIGNSTNLFGINAGSSNSGNNINAFGPNSAESNTANNVNAFGGNSGYLNSFENVNLFGFNAIADENNQNVFSKFIGYDAGIAIQYLGRLSFNNITADRKWELPNASGTIALTSDIPAAGVTSVGLTMPSAFTVTNSPITSSGDIAVTGAGLVSQYVRGDGTLANFPNSTGGGSSINYYLNGSVSQGTFGGTTYYQMSKTPILGAGTNFTRTQGAGNGYIASFITDAGDPSQLNIPGGNWNVEFYFNASGNGGTPSFYAELYKVDVTNVFTLIASDSLNPEGITNGTTVDQYFSSIPVPQTTLLATDRLAVRIFVNTGGRTITLHTENGNLSEVLTTFTTGLTALNGLTQQVQYFNVGTGATNFNIVSSGNTHTFNLLFNIRRNANNSSNNNINYNGYAVTGSAESSAVWTITRLTIAASGSVTTATATNVAWTNRESVIYT